MLLPIVLLALAAQDEPQAAFRKEVQVSRVVVDAHVVDRRGDPIPDLSAADFEALVDGKPAEIESVEWVPAGRSEFTSLQGTTAATEEGDDVGAAQPQVPEGRLIVLFFQPSFERGRLIGFFRMIQHARELLGTLQPADRVAVASFDSHLKLRLDFTNDRTALEAAFFEASKLGKAPDVRVSSFPSIARHFDFDAAKKASTVEKGLALTARALTPIPGAKSLLFFGWGLGVNRNPAESADYGEAMAAFRHARINMFSIDVSDASFHTLETSLQYVADRTGGTYQKTHEFPAAALSRVARQISGRYVIVLVTPPGKRGAHDVEVRLVSRKGEVLHRPSFFDG